MNKNPKKNKALLDQTDRELYSTNQVRRILGVSFTTVKRYVERGFMDCVWIGDRRYFKREDIEHLVKNGVSIAENDDREKPDE